MNVEKELARFVLTDEHTMEEAVVSLHETTLSDGSYAYDIWFVLEGDSANVTALKLMAVDKNGAYEVYESIKKNCIW